MYTRLTGRALNGSVIWCTLSASLALASGVSTTSPSTPAVRRPALRSVTRRTLTSVLVRERSISFCRVADPLQVPSLRRREDPLPQPPYVILRPPPVNPPPVKGRVLWSVHHDDRRGVQLVLGFRCAGHLFSTGSPDRVSALSRPGTRPGIRPVMRNDRLEDAANLSRLPAAFRLPAFASRSSDARRGVGPSLRSAYRTRPNGRARTSTGLPRSARASYGRGGSPLYPEDDGALPVKSSP